MSHVSYVRCDQCEYEHVSAPLDWFRFTVKEPGSVLNTDYDFCSRECLRDWLTHAYSDEPAVATTEEPNDGV